MPNLEDDWSHLGSSDAARQVRQQVLDQVEAHAQQLAKQKIMSQPIDAGDSAAQALPAMLRNIKAQIHSLDDAQLLQRLNVNAFDKVNPQHVSTLAGQLVQEHDNVFEKQCAFDQIAAFHNIPALNNPGLQPSGVNDYDSTLDRADMQALFKECMSYANTFQLDDKQAKALFAAASMGGKNVKAMLDDPSKSALKDLFHSIHMEMLKEPEFTEGMAKRFAYDQEGNVLLNPPGQAPQPKPEPADAADKQTDQSPFSKFLVKDEPKPDQKRPEMQAQQPKPQGAQVDRAEESLRAIWGGGRVPNHGGQIFLGMGHITKRHEELGNGVDKPLSRDNVERNNDYLNSSSLPNFGNSFNETLNLQKKEHANQPKYDWSNPMVDSMLSGPLKMAPKKEK